MLPHDIGHGTGAVSTYLSILMAQAQIADHLVCNTICGISCQVKVKIDSLRCTCKGSGVYNKSAQHLMTEKRMQCKPKAHPAQTTGHS